MNDSEATICFDVTSPGTYITTMRYRPESDGSLRITDQEGKLINGNNFKVNVFAETMFRFSVPAGQQCLHLSAQLNNLPNAKRLLLFTKLSLEKQP